MLRFYTLLELRALLNIEYNGMAMLLKYGKSRRHSCYKTLNKMSDLKIPGDHEYEALRQQLETARNELKNIRQELHKQKSIHDKEVKNIKHMLSRKSDNSTNSDIPINPVTTESTEDIYKMHPIGFIKSWFKNKNGTPRQPTVCPFTRACLKIEKCVFSNPEHSLIGLEEFSYIWILFLFHENKGLGSFHKAKVHPPRLNGTSVGVFSTRSPHRPNAIGLSLTKLEKIEGDTLFLSGVDILDGTPVLDIKPFIPLYDVPCYNESSSLTVPTSRQNSEVHYTEQEALNQEIHNKPTKNWEEPNNQELVPTVLEGNRQNSKKNESVKSINIQQDNFQTHTSDSNSEFPESTQNCDGGHMKLHSVPCEFTYNCRGGPETVSKSSGEEFIDNILSDELVLSKHVADGTTNNDAAIECSIASWLKVPPASLLDVDLTNRAEKELQRFHNKNSHEGKCQFCFSFLLNSCEAKSAIIKLLQQDPRSVYRRKNCADRLYYFCVDVMHITCWFDDELPFTQVLKIKPVV